MSHRHTDFQYSRHLISPSTNKVFSIYSSIYCPFFFDIDGIRLLKNVSSSVYAFISVSTFIHKSETSSNYIIYRVALIALIYQSDIDPHTAFSQRFDYALMNFWYEFNGNRRHSITLDEQDLLTFNVKFKNYGQHTTSLTHS